MKKLPGIAGKLIFIGIIIGILMLARLFIGLKLQDRESSKDVAVASIADAAGGKFKIHDVVLSVPYEHFVKKVNSNGLKYTDSSWGVAEIHARVLNYDATIKTEERKLGIYSAPIFTGKLKIDGEFDCNLRNNSDYTYYFKKATMSIKLKDRTVIHVPQFIINGTEYPVDFESATYEVYEDRYTPVNYVSLYSDFACKEGTNTFSTEVDFRGAKSFGINISSKQSNMNVTSDWKSPGFSSSNYLPTTRELTDEGFTASWFIPFDIGDTKNQIGFDLIQPVDVYKMLDRAITYGFLFIIIPFLVLFLFEVFLAVNLHPIHYLLCGGASVIFFLLLMSFSEHINFGLAYGISALASGLVTSLYVASITGIKKAGFQMCLVFGLLYGYLFFSLKSEDYALLIGSIFTFIVVAALMYFTRKVDWSNIKNTTLKTSGNDE